MGIQEIYNRWKSSEGITLDSRQVQHGQMFFALKGENFDGNKFTEAALDMGAAFAIVDDTSFKDYHDHRIIWVSNVLQCLQDLASYHRDQLHIPVIGITGSNGKTTTKELTRDVLAMKYKVLATKGNLNNHIGVPMTVLSVTQDIELAIIEMGANHQGEIDLLCQIAKPNYGMISNIGKAHLDGFGGVEGIKKGKSEMYRFVAATGGHIFINLDDDILKSLLPVDANLITYHASTLNIQFQNQDSLAYQYLDDIYQTHLYGNYNLPNIAFAIACGQYFGVEAADIHAAISRYKPDNNRSQILEYNGNKIILDAYNANPSSMKASIESFANLGGDQILIIGDMFELGEYSQAEHSRLMDLISQFAFEEVIYIGSIFNSLSEGKKGIFFEDTDAAKVYFKSRAYSNKNIMLKGSRGMAVEKILD